MIHQPQKRPAPRFRSAQDAVISREGLRNLTVEGQSASLALLGMSLGIGAVAAMDGWFLVRKTYGKWNDLVGDIMVDWWN